MVNPEVKPQILLPDTASGDPHLYLGEKVLQHVV